MRRVARTNPATTIEPVVDARRRVDHARDARCCASRREDRAVHPASGCERLGIRPPAGSMNWLPSSDSGPRLGPASISHLPRVATHWCDRRDYVVPDDVKAMLHDVLRHRIAISYRAEAEGLNSDSLLDRIVRARADQRRWNAPCHCTRLTSASASSN